MASPLVKPHSHFAGPLQSSRKAELHGRCCPATFGRFQDHGFSTRQTMKPSGRGSVKVNAFPSLDMVSLMAIMVDHVENSRDYVVHKSIWHLSDTGMKSDPFYDSETYRGQGGDGTVHWYYDKQEDLEASAREELLREELLEEIELRVGGLRELEEAGREEQLTP
ncbi:hypothetical protein PR202_ga02715 [Eleusine coracana subsp. coracana]|uniref:Uncharacterized protein n=1 Tax=Eleusine coracana subsp. coracana TaxID=191504 RepID=A0AAV5BKI5_ELECO|nr:hypothetical protein PR202_ga02715 [Eleusine coracana subsp. coracana]